MFARIGNGVFHYKQSFINTHNKNSSVFQQMEEFFIAIPKPFHLLGMGGHFLLLYPIHFHLLGMGGYFLLLIPKPFSAFGYGRVFLIAYTQSIFTFWVWAGISYCLYPNHSLKMPCEGFPQGIETFLIIFLPEFSSGYPPVCLGLHSVFRLSWRNADGLNC